MKRMSQKTKFRVTFLMLCFIITSVLFVSSIFSYISQISDTKKEMAMLENSYKESLAEEEKLKDESLKL